MRKAHENHHGHHYEPHKFHKIVIGTILLLFSIPLLIIVLQSPQNVRQRAQSTTTPPQCSAKVGVCTTVADGCFADETDVGQLDCSTGQTCCSAEVPPQCFAKKGVCVPAAGGCLSNETNVGALDCAGGKTCCAVNVPPQCKAKNGACILKANECFEGEADAGQLDCPTTHKCCATIPTVSPTQKPTATTQPTATKAPSPTVKPTATPSTSSGPTAIPTRTVQVTLQPTIQPTLQEGATTMETSIYLHGIGNSGDNMSATNSLSNKSPLRTTRQFSIEVSNVSGYNKKLTVPFMYNTTSGAFLGSIQLADISSGSYTVKVKTAAYLEKVIPAQTIQAGIRDVFDITLTAGDINADNSIDALDYNLIINCQGETPTSCDPTQKSMTDLNDDGANNGIDYNLFLRELAGLR